MNTSTPIDYKQVIQEKLNMLRSAAGFEVIVSKINKGVTQEKVDRIEKTLGFHVPQEMLSFFISVNGCQLNWSYEARNLELYGFWDVWAIEKLFFGWDGKISKSNLEAPFEDILWNDYYDEEEIVELKHHKVLESIEGAGSYITCKIVNGAISLYYVNEGEWKLLPVDFNSYLLFIIETLGVGDVRERMIKPKFLENPFSYKDVKALNKLIPVRL